MGLVKNGTSATVAEQNDNAEDNRIRVLHLVSADGKAAPDPLLIPLLTRADRKRVDNHVIAFARGDARFSVLRQRGLPVHEVALSRSSPSPASIMQMRNIVRELQPDVLHAWGFTAQAVAAMFLQGGKHPIPILWSVARTYPVLKKDGWIDRKKLALNVKFARRCSRIVYPSAVAAANFRRVGMPEELGAVIAAGVDADRFRPDDAAREKFRKQFEIPLDAVLIGMYAPFAPEFDHATLMKAVGELIKINPNVYCVLAGRAMVKGNAALTTIVGGGVVGSRTRLVGEWSDMSALFNACDVVCSTATHDSMRLTLAIAMLCGSMSVGTAVGAQGEVLGPFGATVEQGSPDAVARGIRRMLDMPVERKVFVAQSARKHVLQNFNIARSIEKYQELYAQLVAGEAGAGDEQKAEAAKDAAAQPSEAELASLEVIAARVRATAGNFTKPAKKDANEAAAPEPQSEFGSVKAAAPIKKAFNAAPANAQAAMSAAEAGAEAQPADSAKTKGKDDFIDFEVLAVDKPKTSKPVDMPDAAAVSAKKNPEDWLDDGPTIMQEVLVAASEEEVKAAEEKAAAAAKAAAAKAAASAALAAALAAGEASGKPVDPRVLAAVAPRAVGGRK